MDPLTWSFLATKVLEQVFKRGTGQLVGALLPGNPGLAADLAALTDEMRQREPAVASFREALRYLRTDETNQARERLISTVSQLGTAAAAHALLFLLDAARGNQASAEEALHHAMMLNPFLLHGLLAQSGQPIHLPALLDPAAVSRSVPASSPAEGELDQLRRAFVAQLGLDDLLPALAIASYPLPPHLRPFVWHLPLTGGWRRDNPPRVLPVDPRFLGVPETLVQGWLTSNPITGDSTVLLEFQSRLLKPHYLLAVDGHSGQLLWWQKSADLLLTAPDAVYHRTLTKPPAVQALNPRTGAAQGAPIAEPVFRLLVEGIPVRQAWPGGWAAATGGGPHPPDRTTTEQTWILADPLGLDPLVIVARCWLLLQSEGWLAPKSEWFRTVVVRVA